MQKNIKIISSLLISSMLLPTLTGCSKIKSIKDAIIAVTADEEIENKVEEENESKLTKKGSAMIITKDKESNSENLKDLMNKAKGDETNEDGEEEGEEEEEPNDDDLVLIKKYIPDIHISLPYATINNFCGTILYDNNDAYLRYGTVKKLKEVQKIVKEDGYSLKVWDGYRPKSVQEQMWEIVPDSTYVADPSKGSSHNRGNTIDLTLIDDSNGEEIPMPSDFDEFSNKADRDYSDVSDERANNAIYLEDIMVDNGFKPYSGEWWHYTDTDEYPFVDY